MNRNTGNTNNDSARNDTQRNAKRDSWKLNEVELEAIFQRLPGNLGPC